MRRRTDGEICIIYINIEREGGGGGGGGGEEELLLSWILKSYFVKYKEDSKK
jgi:hypothetical protein